MSPIERATALDDRDDDHEAKEAFAINRLKVGLLLPGEAAVFAFSVGHDYDLVIDAVGFVATVTDCAYDPDDDSTTVVFRV